MFVVRAKSFYLSLVIFGYIALWIVMTHGNLSSLWVGGFFVALAVGAFRWLWHRLEVQLHDKDEAGRLKLSLFGSIKFAVYFIRNSVSGAVDVAWVVLRPTLEIDPVIFDYPSRLSSTRERVLMAYVQNLLPGTLTVSMLDRNLNVHVLQKPALAFEQLVILEDVIAGVFGYSLKPQVAFESVVNAAMASNKH